MPTTCTFTFALDGSARTRTPSGLSLGRAVRCGPAAEGTVGGALQGGLASTARCSCRTLILYLYTIPDYPVLSCTLLSCGVPCIKVTCSELVYVRTKIRGKANRDDLACAWKATCTQGDNSPCAYGRVTTSEDNLPCPLDWTGFPMDVARAVLARSPRFEVFSRLRHDRRRGCPA